jgi:6,7-dimethyl-8-ribityllumazine synthase
MAKVLEGNLVGGDQRYAIVAARFNHFLGDRLVEGAIDTLVRHGVPADNITVIKVPGAFELPMVASKAAHAGKYDAVVCLGVLIRGATPHFDYIAAEATKGIATAAMSSGVPVTYGVLTCDTIEQAIERSGTKAGNKGGEAALAALEMVNLYGALGDERG